MAIRIGRYPQTFHALKRLGRLIMAIWLFHGGFGPLCPAISAAPSEPIMEIQVRQNKMSIVMVNATIGDFITQVWERSGIRIEGLETRKKERFSFRMNNTSAEHALKSLLKRLGETSYAFEYRGETLYRVSVVKESEKQENDFDFLADANAPTTNEAPSMDMEGNVPGRFFKSPIITEIMKRPLTELSDREEGDRPTEENEEEMVKRPSAVKVMNVINTSQAEKAGVREGDIIHVYDGVRIESPDMLIREVQNKADKESVTMTVFRNGEPLSFDIQGGFIGVSIAPSVMPD
jgi:type II secretory pathway component GspD/PulD (secretin)